MTLRKTPAVGTMIFFAVAFSLTLYFVFAAIQGDFGLFRRVEIEAEQKTLTAELERLQAQVARMENLTTRLSDDYLDLDLLDERTRDILGYVRANEIVVR